MRRLLSARSRRTPHAGRRCNRRRASVYAAVLMTATLITLIGLTGLSLADSRRRGVTIELEAVQAQQLALAGIEFALQQAATNLNWRTNFVHDAWTENVELGAGTFAFLFFDEEDGDLTTEPGFIQIWGRGKVGDAVRVMSVRTIPFSPVNLLRNGEFDSDAASWSTNNASISWQSGSGPQGSACLDVDINLLSIGGPEQDATGHVANGTTYVVSVWVEEASLALIPVQIELIVTTTDDTERFEFDDPSPSTSWHQIRGTLTPTWTGTATSILWAVDSAANFDMDSAWLYEQGPALEPVWGTYRREADDGRAATLQASGGLITIAININ